MASKAMHVVLLAAVLAACLAPLVAAQQCMLTKVAPAKPVPSLTQCYKYNQLSCCVAGHDAVIKEAYDALWSTTCVREYANLEVLFCLGCNDLQPRYVDESTKTVYICSTFANSLFNDNNVLYDKCGIRTSSDPDRPVLLPGVDTDTAGNKLIHNATELINYKYTYSSGGSMTTVYPLRPPFFQDYEFVVLDRGDNGCFTGAGSALKAFSVAAVFVTALVSMLLSLSH